MATHTMLEDPLDYKKRLRNDIVLIFCSKMIGSCFALGVPGLFSFICERNWVRFRVPDPKKKKNHTFPAALQAFDILLFFLRLICIPNIFFPHTAFVHVAPGVFSLGSH